MNIFSKISVSLKSQYLDFIRWVKYRSSFCIEENEFLITTDQGGVVASKISVLLLKPVSAFQPKLQGFYMLEVSCDSDLGHEDSKLHARYVSGLSNEDIFVFSLKRFGTSKRICYFPQPVEDFYLDSVNELEGISNVNICFVKLTRSFAIERMANRVKRYSGELANNTAALWQQYNRVVSKRNSDSGSYDDWIENVEPGHWGEHANETILFSIVVPIYNPPVEFLISCVDSVKNQTYGRWELLLVDDLSDSLEVRSYLKSLEGLSSNIKVIYRFKNGHISEATNTGIESVGGDFVCFLDHDDLLSPHALNEMALYIASNPSKKIIYSDEDKLDALNTRVTPYFKPDFNYELILSHNYMSHFSVIAIDVVRDLRGLRVGFEGAQDYDLVLRSIQLCGANAVGHISKVLYHWRMIEGSTALSASEKSYSTQVGLKALREYLCKVHPLWRAELGPVSNSFKVERNITNEALVSIVIPTRDQSELLKLCINSILEKTSYKNYEIIIADNDSKEPAALKFLKSLAVHSNINVVDFNKPFNYSEINNYAVNNFVNGDYVLLMNNDVEIIHEDWLCEMMTHASQTDIGCVGAKLLYPNNTIQHAGVTLGIGGVAGHTHKYLPHDDNGYFSQLVLQREVSAVTAAALLVRKSLFDEVGGLDEVNLKVAFNDVDFCLKVKELGYRNIWTPYAFMYHHESISRGHEDTPEKKLRFQKEVEFMISKWGSVLNSDAFYNPNLSNVSEDFSVRSK
jgi:GT2 family glycosyltransferase